jgi:hypothetical protein
LRHATQPPGRALASGIVRIVTDARNLLGDLMGKPIETITGRENRVIAVDEATVLVQTSRSPKGQPVPIEWVQDAIDRLERDREIEISVASVRYRSAFIGAVLKQLPGARVIHSTPPRIRLP